MAEKNFAGCSGSHSQSDGVRESKDHREGIKKAKGKVVTMRIRFTTNKFQGYEERKGKN